MFELGARWSRGRALISLLAPGTPDYILVGSPLARLNALRSDVRPQLFQLVTDLAVGLKIKAEPAQVYDAEVEEIMSCVFAMTNQSTTEPPALPEQLTSGQVKLLQLIAAHEGGIEARYLAAPAGMSQLRVEHLLEELVKKEYLKDEFALGQPKAYLLAEKGRAHLVENGLA